MPGKDSSFRVASFCSPQPSVGQSIALGRVCVNGSQREERINSGKMHAWVQGDEQLAGMIKVTPPVWHGDGDPGYIY